MESLQLLPRLCTINGNQTLPLSIKNGIHISKDSNLELVPLSALFPKVLKSQELRLLLLKLKDSSF
jgi:hypothetical protein